MNCITSLLQLEEEEAKDSFDVDVAVTNPEKIGQSHFISSFCFVESMHNFFCIHLYFIILFGGKAGQFSTFHGPITIFYFDCMLISGSIILIFVYLQCFCPPR